MTTHVFFTRIGFRFTEVPDIIHCYSIIAASPIVREQGVNARRAVLRINRGKYVVHWQQVPTEDNPCEVSFDGGYYATDYTNAWIEFAKRASKINEMIMQGDIK